MKNAPIDISKTAKGLSLPIRIPIGTGAGSATASASFTFVYCREDNTGVCRIKTVQWKVPIEVTADANAPAEIRLTATVPAN
jgi:hypothetical protein